MEPWLSGQCAVDSPSLIKGILYSVQQGDETAVRCTVQKIAEKMFTQNIKLT